jgi:hypothetical protein
MADLVIGSTTLRELKTNATPSQLSVDFGVSIESVINTSLLLLIQHNLQDLASILLGTETLTNNFDGVYEVVKDGIVNGGQSSGTRSLLRERSSGASRALGAGKNAAGCEDEDVTVRELLLELTGETLLHTVETLEGWDGDKDDNCLLAVANFNLSCGNELKRSECGLEICGIGLEIVQSTSNAGLKLRGVLARWARGRDLVEGAHGC